MDRMTDDSPELSFSVLFFSTVVISQKVLSSSNCSSVCLSWLHPVAFCWCTYCFVFTCDSHRFADYLSPSSAAFVSDAPTLSLLTTLPLQIRHFTSWFNSTPPFSKVSQLNNQCIFDEYDNCCRGLLSLCLGQFKIQTFLFKLHNKSLFCH